VMGTEDPLGVLIASPRQEFGRTGQVGEKHRDESRGPPRHEPSLAHQVASCVEVRTPSRRC
jgi:hypothetical protein